MGFLRRRLERLESRPTFDEGARREEIRREVLGRMTDDELDRYEGALRRQEAATARTGADIALLARVEELTGEVRRTLGAKREPHKEGERA